MIARLLFLTLAALLVVAWPAAAQSKRDKSKEEQPPGILFRRSQHFFVYTDLDQKEADDLLERLETMLSLISAYWGKPLGGRTDAQGAIIECYVVKDLSKWPVGRIPDEDRRIIEAGGGFTHYKTFSTNGQFLNGTATVYACADRGTPQHEAVHAYCGQSFGSTGPVWYSEGMAEMGQYWRKEDKSVHVHDAVIEYLRSSPPKSMDTIVNGEEFTGDSWQNYAWRWALCHLLENNTNYSKKFRPLGLALLNKELASFEQVYGDIAEEIVFEYCFFLAHLEQGYRVDLCSWEWKPSTFFRYPKGNNVAKAQIKADRGWQACPARVEKDGVYDCRATGKWQTKSGESVSADGDESRAGRLIGAVLTEDDGKNYRLSEAFELGTKATFTAPAEGKLYLRCQDKWGELAGNKGTVTVKIQAAKGKASKTN